jgi:hypothetical protein
MVEKVAEVPEKKKAPAKKKKKQAENNRPLPQQIHHVIRTISRDGSGSADSWRIQEAEEYLAQFLNNGWRISATHYLGELPEGYTVLWVMLKN